MRDIIVLAQKSYLTGMIGKHVTNVEVLLNNPTGIGGVADGHQDIQEAVEVELGKIADYYDKLEMLHKFFVKKEEKKKDDKK